MSRITRRSFVATLTVVPMQSFLINASSAAELLRLSEQEAMATALGYLEASETPGQTCENCSLYSPAEDSEWGGCVIFQGNLVATKGWCKSWALRPV